MLPTAKLIELVVRPASGLRGERASAPTLAWTEDKLKPGGAAVSFLDKMSPDVAGPRLTLQQRACDVLSRCCFLFEALSWREARWVYSAVVSGHDRD